MNKVKLFLTALMAVPVLIGCNSDDDATPDSTTSDLEVNLSGLEALGADFVYEGWIIVDGAPVSTGTFTSVTFPQTFTVNTEELEAATKFVLSIEPAVDADPAPSDQKLVAGDFSGTTAEVSTSIAPALGDFSSVAGQAFLRTPTDETGENNGNDENGVWFGEPGAPPTGALDLPTLPAGWVYEGWVIGDAGPISTGTFTEFDQVDSGNPFSGAESNAGPPVPGEDFFLNAPAGEAFPLDVRGRTVVISVEPSPDDSPAPFLLKPLVLMLDADAATAPAVHAFGQNLGSLPTGTVTR